MAKLLFKRTKTAMRQYGEDIVRRIKRQLKIDKTYATGRTERSVAGILTDAGGVISYGIYSRRTRGGLVPVLSAIDQGRGPGGQPPVSEIEKWMKAKGIQPRAKSGKYKRSTPNSRRKAAYWIAQAIGRKGTIKRYGYKGSNVLDFVTREAEPKGMTNILNAYSLDIDEQVTKAAKG